LAQPQQEEGKEEELLQPKSFSNWNAQFIQRQIEEKETVNNALQQKALSNPAFFIIQRQEEKKDDLLQGQSECSESLAIQRQDEEEEPKFQGQAEKEEEQERLLQPFSNIHSTSNRRDDNSIIHPSDSGLPLSTTIKEKVEPVIGADLSQVKVHTSKAAADSAEAIGAKAFTHKNHIWLGRNQNSNDLKLMAHELTHVAQQRGLALFDQNSTAKSSRIDRKINNPKISLPSNIPESLPHDILQRENGDNGTSNSRAAEIADEVYDALDWFNNEPRAINALQGHSAYMRRIIQIRFRERHDQSLKNYLKDQLSGDWLVKAFALLSSTNYHEPHTAMALALIPIGTRDTEVFRLLEGRDLAARQALKNGYNQAFRDIGDEDEPHTLEGDLKDDLSGWRKEKALALLNRDLKSADHLYFDSVGITGTHDESVISRIQGEWQKGPAEFAKFEKDWDDYVRNQKKWTDEDETWTDMSLYQAMDDELSGETWELVRAVLIGYIQYKAYGYLEEDGLTAGREPLTEDQRFEREEILLQVAEASLDAATTGGFTGLGTNEQQVFRAVRTIRQIWMQRIERARQTRNLAKQREYQESWNRRQNALMSFIPSEMDEGTADFMRVRLLLAGELDAADEVYLAGQASDYDKVIELVTKYWREGKINELLEKAWEERRETRNGQSGVLLRPSYRVHMIIPLTHGDNAVRVLLLTRNDWSDARRGAERLKLELDQGDNDSDLKKGYELLKNPGIAGDLRNGVIETFVNRYLSNVEGDRDTEKFLNYIAERYENSHTVWEFKDLIDPTTNPAEMVRRAEGRLASTRSGIMDHVLNDFVRDIDQITGEDTEAVALESLERLRFIAQTADAHPDELAAMMLMTGKRTPQELAQFEYQDFQARLNDLRELKRSIAEAIATIAELVIEAALTIATGGAAAGALLASISAAVAGMLIREALLGQDYDLISRQNAQQLAVIIASHGFGSFGNRVFRDIIEPENLERLGRMGAFLEGVAEEGARQLGQTLTTVSFENRMPTAESIGASALSILGNTLGTGVNQAMTHNMADNMPTIERMRRTFAGNLAQNVISGVSEEGSELIRTGVQNLTGAEIATRFGQKTAAAIRDGLIDTVGDIGARQVGEARRRQREQEESAGIETQPDSELSDLQENPNRITGDIALSDSAAESNVPGIMAVAHVFGDHAISIVRTGDMSIRIIICSNSCSQLRTLLEGVRRTAPSEMETSLDLYQSQVNDIEQRLRENPNDYDALSDFNELAASLRALSDRLGEQTLIGSRPDATIPAVHRNVSDIMDNGVFTIPELQRLYEQYRQRKEAEGGIVAPPELWARLTRGEARAILDRELGVGWTTSGRGRRRERGEVFVQPETLDLLLQAMPEYPHENFVPFPLAAGEEISLGPSVGRGLSGADIQLAYTIEGLQNMHPDLRSQFHDDLQRSIREGNAIEVGRDEAGNSIYWPRDSSGHAWQVHHIQPLEWNGPDAPSNWVAVPYNIHSDLHRWWNQLKRLVQTDIEVIEALETGEQAESVLELTETTS
jgi:hypothetical protein